LQVQVIGEILVKETDKMSVSAGSSYRMIFTRKY